MAGRLSAAQLGAFQTAATATLDISGVLVQRATTTSDGYGTYSETWATIATVAAGWAKPTASIMQQYAGLIGALAAWTVRLPYGTDCLRNDRIVMPTGEVLTVQADLSQSSYSTCKRVLATAVR